MLGSYSLPLVYGSDVLTAGRHSLFFLLHCCTLWLGSKGHSYAAVMQLPCGFGTEK
jgi:hypothetical protein